VVSGTLSDFFRKLISATLEHLTGIAPHSMGLGMAKTDIKFRNLHSRLLLGYIARQQPILPGKFPAPVTAFLRWFEANVLRVNVSGYRVDRPIFLLGLPRSGTTMLQDTMCRHPGIAYINNSMNRFPDALCATDYFRRKLRLDFEIERYLADSVPVSPGSPSDALSFWTRWFDIDPFSLAYHEFDAADISPATRSSMDETIRRVIWCYGDPQRRFFNKVIHCTPYVELLNALFPDAKLVHIVRDPRMTANSMVKLCRLEIEHEKKYGLYIKDSEHGDRFFISYPRLPKLKEYVDRFGLLDLRTTANIWRDTIEIVDRAMKNGVRVHEVRYEDLLADAKGELARIYEFCELPDVTAENKSYWSKVATIGSIHHQRNYGDFAEVEEICRDSMNRHGYRPASG
jgi:hypothetical protein